MERRTTWPPSRDWRTCHQPRDHSGGGAESSRNHPLAGHLQRHIVAGDGAEGYPDSAPYDRAIFTAGAFDLPHYFYEQLRDEGLLLIVSQKRRRRR